MKNIIITAGWIAILVGIAMTIIVTYWLTYPYKPLVFNDEVFPIQKEGKIATQGGTLRYTSNYCKYGDNQFEVSRAFENDLIFQMPSMLSNRPAGCHVINVEVPIPHELPPGVYHLVNNYKTQVNPLRSITIQQDTEDFTILSNGRDDF